MPRIVCLMSGGVDSSVAAALLQEAGHEVVGLFLRNGVPSDPSAGRRQGCCSAADARDARLVADALGIPFYAWDASAPFGALARAFADDYAAGRTPNPCARCNPEIKFGIPATALATLGADGIASGHYARLGERAGAPAILRARDPGKDQSYVLFGLPRGLLPRLRLPLGDLRKEEVRAIARARSLPVADKADSQEICFVPGGDYRAVVRRLRPDAFRPGEVVDERGATIGRHGGVANFTVGQRRGLGLSGGPPRFVAALDAPSGRVVAAPRGARRVRRFSADRVNWLAFDAPPPSVPCEVATRYRARPAPALVEPRADGSAEILLREPAFPPAPGQAAVFYEGDAVLGGGWIR